MPRKTDPSKPRESFVDKSRRTTAPSDPSLKGKLPKDILEKYEIHEWRHAAAILSKDFPEELNDIIDVLRSFKIHQKDILVGGGGKSPITQSLEQAFVGEKKSGKSGKKWSNRRWKTAILLDSEQRESPTHEVDCVKSKVALEIEWSNKDPFFDRDLNNFRLLFELGAISVGVIITKTDELAAVFKDLGVWSKYGTSTTWMSKLLPRINGGGGGGCPILVFGIRKCQYVAE